MTWLVAAVLLTCQPAMGETVIYPRFGGEPVTLVQMADDLAERDVVFLGEDHDSAAGHRLQLKILEALHQRRPDLVLSLEMFERDVQGLLDDYLAERISEEELLAQARPWREYKEHYRPLVEYARQQNLDVVAANVPRRIARQISQGETPSRDENVFMARSTTAPRDRYYELFCEVMREHVGADDAEGLERMYRAQCLKDDTMAEAIADYFAAHPHRRPLVVHVCGKFHSDYGLGTAARFLARRPLEHVGVVSMEAAQDVQEFDPAEHQPRGHYLLVVPKEKKEKQDEAASK